MRNRGRHPDEDTVDWLEEEEMWNLKGPTYVKGEKKNKKKKPRHKKVCRWGDKYYCVRR